MKLATFGDVTLIPFYALSVMYFLMYQPFKHYPPYTPMAAVCKALPIWSLVFYVKSKYRSKNFLPSDKYSKNFILGLLFSSAGDICMVFSDYLSPVAVLTFGAAHVCYIMGIGQPRAHTRTRNLFILGAACFCLVIQSGMDSYKEKLVIGIYVCLLTTLGYVASAKYDLIRTDKSFLAYAGSLSFLLSDAIILFDKYVMFMSDSEGAVMTTYYIAQLGLALSC